MSATDDRRFDDVAARLEEWRRAEDADLLLAMTKAYRYLFEYGREVREGDLKTFAYGFLLGHKAGRDFADEARPFVMPARCPLARRRLALILHLAGRARGQRRRNVG